MKMDKSFQIIKMNINDHINSNGNMAGLDSLISFMITDIANALDSIHLQMRIAAAAAGGRSRNIIIPIGSSSGAATPGLLPSHYTGAYSDLCTFSSYSPVTSNPASVNPNWQLARSCPQQQQQHGYGNRQNITSQQAWSTGASNDGGRTVSTSGAATPGLPPSHYPGVDSNLYPFSSYSPVTSNPASVNPNWQLARSYPQQQQQHGYGNRQNITSQQAWLTGASNNGIRTASTLDQSGSDNSSDPSLTLQYTLNDVMPTTYPYEIPVGLIPDLQQAPSSQTNRLAQMNAAYNAFFDPSQPIQSQQPTNVDTNTYEASDYFSQQSQHQQRQPPQ